MDRDQAQVIKSYWHQVVEELEVLIKMELNALRVCKPEDTVKHQEKISAYEGLKTLPETVEARY